MNDPPVSLWIITHKEGTVICVHCTGCMAGLGECCSHIASVLFYLETWTRIYGKLSCTQVKCTWLLPTYVKEVTYDKVKNIILPLPESSKVTWTIQLKSLNNLIYCLLQNLQHQNQENQKNVNPFPHQVLQK